MKAFIDATLAGLQETTDLPTLAIQVARKEGAFQKISESFSRLMRLEVANIFVAAVTAAEDRPAEVTAESLAETLHFFFAHLSLSCGDVPPIRGRSKKQAADDLRKARNAIAVCKKGVARWLNAWQYEPEKMLAAIVSPTRTMETLSGDQDPSTQTLSGIGKDAQEIFVAALAERNDVYAANRAKVVEAQKVLNELNVPVKEHESRHVVLWPASNTRTTSKANAAS